MLDKWGCYCVVNSYNTREEAPLFLSVQLISSLVIRMGISPHKEAELLIKQANVVETHLYTLEDEH